MSKRTIVRLTIAALFVALVAVSACSTSPSTPTSNAPSSGSGNAAGGGTSGGSASANAIVLQNFSFQPASTEVKVGTKVTWTNQDSTQHTVTADDGAFTSSTLDTGKSFSFTFANAGTFKYHCSIHPSMVGQVVVK